MGRTSTSIEVWHLSIILISNTSNTLATMTEGDQSLRRRPSSDTDERTKHKVKFFGRVRVKDIENCDEITDEDRVSRWYSADEMRRIREENELEIEQISNGSPSQSMCRHGLHTGDERKAGREAIMLALHEVLTEQELQWDEGNEDPELLADIYFEASVESQRTATEKAQRLASQVAEMNRRQRPKRKTKSRFKRKKSKKFSTSATLPYEMDRQEYTKESFASLVGEAIDIVSSL